MSAGLDVPKVRAANSACRIPIRRPGFEDGWVRHTGRERRGRDYPHARDRLESLACGVLPVPGQQLTLDGPDPDGQVFKLSPRRNERGSGKLWQSGILILLQTANKLYHLAGALRGNENIIAVGNSGTASPPAR